MKWSNGDDEYGKPDLSGNDVADEIEALSQQDILAIDALGDDLVDRIVAKETGMSTQRFGAKRILSIRDHGTFKTLTFHCPGCDRIHQVWVGRPDDWTWDGNEDSPTFGPSIMVHRGEPNQCHSFVEGGSIRFLADCHHSLAGQTVPMVPLPQADSYFQG